MRDEYSDGLRDGLEWSSLDKDRLDARRHKVDALVWTGIGVGGLALTLLFSSGGWTLFIYGLIAGFNLIRARTYAKAEDRASFECKRWLADHPDIVVVDAQQKGNRS